MRMRMKICNDHGLLDFTDACIRESWSAILPAAIILLISASLIPKPQPLRRFLDFIQSPFNEFLTLQEAEALENANTSNNDATDLGTFKTEPNNWRTFVFVFIGLGESLCWIISGCYRLYDHANYWRILLPFLFAVSWSYTIVRPVARPIQTPPFDLVTLYLLFSAGSLLDIGGSVYDRVVFQAPPLEPLLVFGKLANFIAILSALTITLNIPAEAPSSKIDPKDIGSTLTTEDYATLWQWATFSWIYPLIRLGRNTTLHDKDVWNLSPTMQSRPLSYKFGNIHRSTLFKRIWTANSLDIIIDFSLTVVGVVFNYTGPFFLKKILDAIDVEDLTPERKMKAYLYAFLAFVCTILKTQCDLQHLWFARRASTRVRSELMAAIYVKSLKRKDFSGIVDKTKMQEAEGGKPNGEVASKKGRRHKKGGGGATSDTGDEAKPGASAGKIVNLMSTDTNRISRMLTIITNLYGAPFEIIIACVFLYQLLGLSAFAGFLVLIVGWPLNNFLVRRNVRINKGIMAAQDKRMNVLNEMIGAIKFIKLFAWEERWIDRAMEARELELKWVVKVRINQIMFNLLTTCSPILVSIISFFAFVMSGNELTISTAFTAIALFNMVRAPLKVVPTYLVHILQARVALERISVFLDEEEVTDQASTLKATSPSMQRPQPQPRQEGLGLENAYLQWNEISSPSSDNNNGDAKNKKRKTVDANEGDVEEATPSPNNSERQKFELQDLSVRFPEGRLTVVTGPTASGKTALLMAVMGEMTLLSGSVLLYKDPTHVDENGYMNCISYSAQLPWLLHRSIKENILFGYPYDEERYKTVVECCALLPDLEILEDGDATEIGARGVNLSGGQKARVALARAVYARTKYVLLDDPLSAVDSHTSRFLYERLLCGPLLANRTVVLVTHHVHLVLPAAHYLVRMLDGRIDAQGLVSELRDQGVLSEIESDASLSSSSNKVESSISKEDSAANRTAGDDSDDSPSDSKTNVLKKPRRLIKEEFRETGGVRWSIYNTYLKASSYRIWFVLAVIIFVSQFLGIAEKLWIRTWGEAYKNDTTTTTTTSGMHRFTILDLHGAQSDYPYPHFGVTRLGLQTNNDLPRTSGPFGIVWPNAQDHPLFYVGIYAAIGLTTALVGALSVTAQYTGALRASRILFKRLLLAIVHATFRFHDITPQGRILNRFGKDIDTIDSSLAGTLQAVNSTLAGFLIAIFTVGVVLPYFCIPAFFIGLIYRHLAIGYLNTGRDLRRMESTTRSPIYSHFGEMLEGVVTVRAFGVERRFLDNLHTKIDVTTKMWYMFWMTNRWLLLNFDTLGAVIILLASVFSISSLKNDAGLAALCITSAMSFTFSVYWTCRYWTNLELDLNSVERVVEYLDVPQEPPLLIDSNRAPAYWPSNSAGKDLLVVENLEVKYAPELPAVIKNVSFSLKAGERVGLLGRTGSGKSTLATSIMRFVDLSGGRILIDGIDISTIGVYDLRSRMTFIPQDATLFSGTLRENLDPFGDHTDIECLEALRRVRMITNSSEQSASSSPSNSGAPSRAESITSGLTSSATTTVDNNTSKLTVSLDTQVSAGGKNFSQGQRQLIAVARALIRKSPIIILDEATSSIDFDTDSIIQSTIREEFTGSLLLTVAHRLRTVIDYDRLIVLDKGEIVEFDTPWNLINREGGIFRSMCLKTGTFGELEAAAKAASTDK